MGHARALLTIEESLQKALAEEIASKQLSVREVERLVARQGGSRKQKQTQRKRDPNTIKLEKEIPDDLGARVRISYNKKGAGKLEINYKNQDQLQACLL
mgnify:CR=1 FL=1